MYNRAKGNFIKSLPALFTCMLLLSACENSLNDIQQIASKEQEKPIARSRDVDVIYSDSAKVKGHLTTPLMIEHDEPGNSYREMTKGVKIIFYNDDLTVKGTITSDYAIQRDKQNLIEFHKNVVAKNAQGETFKSDELIDDMANKKLYSTKPVQITMQDGNVMEGTGFNSNESLYPWHIEQSTGTFHVDEKQAGVN